MAFNWPMSTHDRGNEDTCLEDAAKSLARGLLVARRVAEDRSISKVNRVCFGSAGAASRWEHLLDAGVSHVVSLSRTPHCPSLQYLDISIRDKATETLIAKLPDAIRFMQVAMEDAQSRVFVHCFAGQSRSIAVVLGFLIWQGWSLRDAFSAVRRVRPQACPNTGFMWQLKAWEAAVLECGCADLDAVAQRSLHLFISR
mmetsp:Transcript_11927/g.26341  ORF Transcript_11927/g.26341 Transcript_11927/m.26341 type:complete len:199 (+) Transcript_11927:116-712(+)